MNPDEYPRVKLYVGAVLIGLFAAVTVLLISSLYFLVKNAQAGAETRGLLVECTIPPNERTPPVEIREADTTSDCFVRSQQRLARSVGQISDISVVAAACGAANPGDVKATRQCVEEALAP